MGIDRSDKYNLRGALKASLATGGFGVALWLGLRVYGAVSGLGSFHFGRDVLYEAVGIFAACFLLALGGILMYAYYIDS